MQPYTFEPKYIRYANADGSGILLIWTGQVVDRIGILNRLSEVHHHNPNREVFEYFSSEYTEDYGVIQETNNSFPEDIAKAHVRDSDVDYTHIYEDPSNKSSILLYRELRHESDMKNIQNAIEKGYMVITYVTDIAAQNKDYIVEHLTGGFINADNIHLHEKTLLGDEDRMKV